jgi:hypothetical protein
MTIQKPAGKSCLRMAAEGCRPMLLAHVRGAIWVSAYSLADGPSPGYCTPSTRSRAQKTSAIRALALRNLALMLRPGCGIRQNECSLAASGLTNLKGLPRGHGTRINSEPFTGSKWRHSEGPCRGPVVRCSSKLPRTISRQENTVAAGLGPGMNPLARARHPGSRQHTNPGPFSMACRTQGILIEHARGVVQPLRNLEQIPGSAGATPFPKQQSGANSPQLTRQIERRGSVKSAAQMEQLSAAVPECVWECTIGARQPRPTISQISPD